MILDDFKIALATEYFKDGNVERAAEILKKDAFEPIFDISAIYHDSLIKPGYSYQQLSDITHDITALYSQFSTLSFDMKDELDKTKAILDTFYTDMIQEKDKLKDFSILCVLFKDFQNTLDITNFKQDVKIEDKIISTYTDKRQIDYSIENIFGNGEAGNTNIINSNGGFVEAITTDNIDHIHNKNLFDKYEYQKLISSTIDSDIHTSPESIVLSLELKANTPVYDMKIVTQSNLIVKSLHISNDGVNYTELLTYRNRELFNSEIHDNNDNTYINGSCILSFNKPVSFIKIALTTNDITDEKVGIVLNNLVIEKPLIKRNVIQINEIILYEGTFEDTILVTDNLLQPNEEIDSIAIYSEDISNDLSFELVINGEMYQVKPINSLEVSEKPKIIKYNDYGSSDEVLYITSPMKELSLRIINKSTYPSYMKIKILKGKGDMYNV